MNTIIKKWFASCKFSLNPFYEALFSDDINEMQKYINECIQLTFPNIDFTNSDSNSESFYHAFILGLVADLRSDFIITSIDDVQIEPHDKKRYPDSYIFEFMIQDEDDKNLKDTAERALMQITLNNYNKGLEIKGFAPENIKEYGFGFCEKQCEIMFQTAKIPRHPELSPPRFDKNCNHQFLEKEKVFILDKNEFDIWEGIIEIINGVQYRIHYPDYPEDDESVEKERILPKTHKNKLIFRYQEEKRLKFAQIKQEKNGSDSKIKKHKRKRKKFT